MALLSVDAEDVCYNPERAAWEATQRAAILDSLRQQLGRGDKALVGNSGYRRYLRVVGDDHFVLDEAKAAEEARYAGSGEARACDRSSLCAQHAGLPERAG